MPMITWTKILETGYAQIDDEHRMLVELLNDLQEASRSGVSDEVKRVVVELERKTLIHFAHEEALMQEFGYAAAEAHRAEHKRLIHEMRAYIDEFEAGRFVASSVALFMQRWLLQHIVNADRQLGESLRVLGRSRLSA